MKSPAEIVIEMLDGIRPAARTLGVTPGAVHYWKGRGQVPQRHHKALLAMSKRRRFGLTATDLIFGRK